MLNGRKNKVKKIICAAIPALVVGIAIGYAGSKYIKNDVANEQVVSKSEKKVKVVKQSLENNAETRALRNRIRELERQLSEEGSKEVEIAVDENANRPSRENRNFNPREWLERMKTENPEQYAQHTNRFARWRDSRRRQAVSKLDFLSSVDTSTMNAKEKETHEELQRLIEMREELQSNFEKSFASGTMSDEDRRNQWEEMRNIDHQISRLNASERQTLIKKTAEAIGFTGEDVGEIAGTINKIIEATEGGFGGRGRGGRGGRGGRR